MSGNNSWILHTPDDGRKQLYVAPGTDGANWDWSKQTQFMPDGNVNVSGNITAAGRNILGEIDELKNKPAAAGSTDFDAFTNGNDAKFSPGWQVGADWPWDPSIRGPGRGGFAHTVNKDNLGDDENDNNTSNRTADIAVPAGMKSGFLFHLPWSNCRHFDIFGVLANGKEVFIRRVNAFQNVRNTNTDNFHDGAAVVPITRVDRFAHIRIKGVRGRIHYMGTGWTKNNLDSYASGADSGFVSAQNIVGSIDNFVVNENLKSKTLRVENGISMGGQGEFSLDSPGVGGGRFLVDNQGNTKIGGKLIVKELCVDKDNCLDINIILAVARLVNPYTNPLIWQDLQLLMKALWYLPEEQKNFINNSLSNLSKVAFRDPIQKVLSGREETVTFGCPIQSGSIRYGAEGKNLFKNLERGSTRFTVNPTTMGGDPIPGAVKDWTADYICDSNPQVDEMRVVALVEAIAKNIQISGIKQEGILNWAEQVLNRNNGDARSSLINTYTSVAAPPPVA